MFFTIKSVKSRKEFVKNQRLLREQENEEDCSMENDDRNNSIATDQIL